MLSALIVSISAIALSALVVKDHDPAAHEQAIKQCTAENGSVAEEGRIAACTAVIDSGQETGKRLAEVYFWRGNGYGNTGAYDLAIADYDAAMPLDPDASAIPGNRGTVYLIQNNFSAALEDFNKALAMDPEWADLYSYRSACHLNLGDLDPALADADEAIRRSPRASDYYIQRAYVHNSREEPAKAIADLDTAFVLGVQPNFMAKAHFARSVALEATEEFTRAIESVNEALALEPENADYLHLRCWLRAVWGQELNKALPDCDAAIARAATHLTHGTRGFLNMRRADPWSAIKDFEASLGIKADHAFALYGRGIARLRVGQTAEGQADIVAALSIDSEIPKDFTKYGLTP